MVRSLLHLRTPNVTSITNLSLHPLRNQHLQVTKSNPDDQFFLTNTTHQPWRPRLSSSNPPSATCGTHRTSIPQSTGPSSSAPSPPWLSSARPTSGRSLDMRIARGSQWLIRYRAERGCLWTANMTISCCAILGVGLHAKVASNWAVEEAGWGSGAKRAHWYVDGALPGLTVVHPHKLEDCTVASGGILIYIELAFLLLSIHELVHSRVTRRKRCRVRLYVLHILCILRSSGVKLQQIRMS